MLHRFSRVRLFVTLRTVALQALLSVGIFQARILLCPAAGDLPYPAIKPTSLTSPALAGRFFTTSASWEAHIRYIYM